MITFASGLTGTIVNTVDYPLVITDPVTIEGPGASRLAVSGGGDPTFVVESGPTSISGLTLSGARAIDSDGGAIFNAATLEVDNVTFEDNQAAQGGGIANGGMLTVKDSIFEGTNSAVFGMDLWNVGDATVEQSTIISNATYSSIEVDGGFVTAANSTLIGGGIELYNEYSGLFLPNAAIVNSTLVGTNFYRDFSDYETGFVTASNTIIEEASCDQSFPIGAPVSVFDGGNNISFGSSSCPGVRSRITMSSEAS